MKRFWKTVGVEKQGDAFMLPQRKALLATLIAHEWETQETLLKPHALPVVCIHFYIGISPPSLFLQTSLASRAIDALGEEQTRAEVRASLLDYLDTDTICFFQDEPPPLVVLQEKHWEPLLNWARSTFNVEIQKFDSILYNSQPQATKQKFDELLAQFDGWEMAAMERATYTTKSFIVALALVKRHLTAEEAAETAQVEVNSQIERWGEVEDSHDVDFHDVRRQLGSAACLVSDI